MTSASCRRLRHADSAPCWAQVLGRGAGLLACMLAGIADAQDMPTEFAPFRPREAQAVRATVPTFEWERLARGADRFGPPPLRSVNAEMIALARGGRWSGVLDLVTRQGADPAATDQSGVNVLVLAVRAGQHETVRDLVRQGASLDRRSDDGFTPLGAAAFLGQSTLVRLLLKAGADPAEVGASGQTPLHLAALAGRIGTIDTMLTLRVEVDLLNSRRETALDLAAQNGQLDAMERLLAAGADTRRAGRR